MRIYLLVITVLLQVLTLGNVSADPVRDIQALEKARERIGKRVKQVFRLEGVDILDLGLNGEVFTAIDIEQMVCQEAETENELDEFEDFVDTIARLRVSNSLPYAVRVKKFWFRMPYLEVSSKRVRSEKLALTGNRLIAPGEEGEVIALMLNQQEGQKIFPGHGVLTEAGFRTIKFTLRARAKNGSRILRSVKSTFNFQPVNRCS